MPLIKFKRTMIGTMNLNKLLSRILLFITQYVNVTNKKLILIIFRK